MKLLFQKPMRRAFTLLEVMVALGLMSIVVVAIYSSWTAILKGSKVALDSSAAAQRTRMTMRALHDSLLCACLFNENARYYSFLADSEGDFATLSFVARLPKSFPRSGKFGDLNVRRLTFNVEDGPDSKKNLVLRQNPLLMEVDADEDSNPLILAKDVNKFMLEFFDQQSGEWLTEWTQTNQLPKMMRVSVVLGNNSTTGPSQVQDAMVSTLALPAQPVRVEWQMPVLGPGSQNPGSNNGGNDKRDRNQNKPGPGGFGTGGGSFNGNKGPR